jgi:hypothetical protein
MYFLHKLLYLDLNQRRVSILHTHAREFERNLFKKITEDPTRALRKEQYNRKLRAQPKNWKRASQEVKEAGLLPRERPRPEQSE